MEFVNNTKKDNRFSLRAKTIIILIITLLILGYIIIYGGMISEESLAIDFSNKLNLPSKNHIFGTDSKGKDMYLRTIKGLYNSISIGTISAFISLLISLVFSLLVAIGDERVDRFVVWITDVFMSIPHMMFLILISVALGRGKEGVIIGLSITHWPSLTRIIRGEILQIKSENYIKISKAMGKSNIYIAINHILPNLVPQIIVGVILLIPHAILHESSITFLGFGLDISNPSIGAILQESMKYLIQGYWHLVLFPGIILVIVIMCFNSLGDNLKKFIDPFAYHR